MRLFLDEMPLWLAPSVYSNSDNAIALLSQVSPERQVRNGLQVSGL
jgi:hypothetical protein